MEVRGSKVQGCRHPCKGLRLALFCEILSQKGGFCRHISIVVELLLLLLLSLFVVVVVSDGGGGDGDVCLIL